MVFLHLFLNLNRKENKNEKNNRNKNYGSIKFDSYSFFFCT
jgi:hypothetical protein